MNQRSHHHLGMLLAIILLLGGSLAFVEKTHYPAGIEESKVFVAGTDGYHTFRIPAIIALPNGRLLAFAEGRVASKDDYGNVDIVMKTSDDHGLSWSALKILVDADTLQAGNPAPVVDVADSAVPNGRVFLFYNIGNNHEIEVRKGNGYRKVQMISSDDQGNKWTLPKDITRQVHKIKQPKVNENWNDPADWRGYFNTPGHATQLFGGPFNGRIYVAANHTEGDPSPSWSDGFSHGFYSDDHGKTFKLSEKVDIPGSNEATAAQLTGGKFMINMRNQAGDIRKRLVAISSDGGVTWDTSYVDNHLPDPICEGSLLKIGEKNGKAMLAFSNCANIRRRDSLTVRLSEDDGQTWPKSWLVAADASKKNYTAYSDIVLVDSTSLGILYEKNDYTEIVFAPKKISEIGR